LTIDPVIRFVMMGTVRGEIIARGNRADISIPFDDKELEFLVRLRAEYLTEINKRLNGLTGGAEYVVTYYRKFIEAMFFRGDNFLLLTLERNTEPEAIINLCGKTRSLWIEDVSTIAKSRSAPEKVTISKTESL
jgi:hypothetical protein